jgi:hypothetical protein
MWPKRHRALTLVVLGLSGSPACADFRVTGPITGRECSGWLVFLSCRDVAVDAITTPAADREQLFRLTTSAARSTEYEAKTGTCFIRIEAGAASLLGGIVVNQFLQRQPDGTFAIISPSLLIFPCAPE